MRTFSLISCSLSPLCLFIEPKVDSKEAKADKIILTLFCFSSSTLPYIMNFYKILVSGLVGNLNIIDSFKDF